MMRMGTRAHGRVGEIALMEFFDKYPELCVARKRNNYINVTHLVNKFRRL